MKNKVKQVCGMALKFAFCCLAISNACGSSISKESVATSKDGKFRYEIYGIPADRPILILLHGAGGPTMMFYRKQAELFAENGYAVLLPHYFDVTKSSDPTTEHYQAWVDAVRELLGEYGPAASAAHRKVVLVGYSLGASVALAAGSQGARVDGIAEWYGSLPDDFYNDMQGMPPLLILHGERDSNIPVVNAQQLIKLCVMRNLECEHHIYPDQGHGFAGAALKDADSRTLAFFSGLSQRERTPQPSN